MCLVAVSALLGVGDAAANTGPVLHPNSKNYGERNPSAATGRSGNATLTTRALLSQTTGSTVIDVTTGKLDSTATAPGSITKAQIKGYDGVGDVRWTMNYNGLTGGGTLQYTYANLFRGQPIQVQTNIKQIDGKRTDVVTVSGNVKLRPDLKVGDIAAPDRVIVGTAVNIAATVTEIHGDVGATADCLLYTSDSVDPVDQAVGVWVDGGDTISCVFTHTFDTTGTKTVTVKLANVVPTDDSLDNNSASKTIVVVANNEPLYWSAYANGYDYDRYKYRSEGWYRYGDGTWSNGSDWNYTFDYSDLAHDWTSIYAWTPSRVTFPLQSFNVSFRNDGTTIGSLSGTNVNADWQWGDATYGGNWLWRYDYTANTYFYISEHHNGDYQASSMNGYRYAGRATYFASGYYRYWYNSPWGSYDYYWTYNPGSYSYGTVARATTVDIDMTVQDAAGSIFHAAPSLAMQSGSYAYSYPYTCYEYNSTSYYSYASRYCYEYDYAYTYWYGYASGTN